MRPVRPQSCQTQLWGLRGGQPLRGSWVLRPCHLPSWSTSGQGSKRHFPEPLMCWTSHSLAHTSHMAQKAAGLCLRTGDCSAVMRLGGA